MLFSVVGLLYLAQLGKALQCSLLGQTATTQIGYNFIVDYFYLDQNVTALPVPYAVDMCTVNSMVSNSTYVKYVCGNNSGVVTVTKTQYSDSNCTKSAKIMDHWFQGESQQGDVGYFECGLSDGYVEMTFSNSTNCTSNNTRTVYFGLGGCGSNRNYSLQFTCSKSQAMLQVFLDLNVPPGFNSSSFPLSSNVPLSSEPSVNESFSSSNLPSSSATPIGGGNGGGGIQGNSFGLAAPVVCQMFCDQVTIGSTCVDIFPGYSIYGTMGTCYAPNVGASSTSTTTGSPRSTTTTAKPGGSASLFTLNCFLLALVGTFFLF